MGALFNEPRGQAVLWLFLGAVGLLAAVLGVARCLFAEPEAAPDRRALAHWLPIAVAVVVASSLGQATLAVGIAFGASVAALSAVTGFLLVTHPLGIIPARARRVWTFVPVVALLTFILGFRGVLGWFEAAVLAGQGALAWMIWSARDGDDAEGTIGDATAPAASRRPLDGRTLGLVALALALAALAAWAACRGAERLQHAEFRQHGGLMATMVLGIVLALPMAMTGAPAALEGRAWGPITAQVGVVMLNLCVLLPVAVAIPGVRTILAPGGTTAPPAAAVRPPGATVPTTAPATEPADRPPTAEAPDDDAALAPAGPWEGIIYPRIAWRIDAVALLILSLLLVPAADGRLPLDRRIGVGLTVGYLLYLLSMMLMATGG